MIVGARGGHGREQQVLMQPMPAEDSTDELSSVREPRTAQAVGRSQARANHERLRAAFDLYFDYVWRLVRRLGVPEASADDATQQVFLTLSAKLEVVLPGKERAFLTGTAFRVASNQRRGERRNPERPWEQHLASAVDPSPSPEQLIDASRQRAWLDHVLDQLPLELRAVLVLFELEDLSAPEIAKLLELPVGTVASRLRRARQQFFELAEALREELAERDEVIA